jgi:hypothetical protein
MKTVRLSTILLATAALLAGCSSPGELVSRQEGDSIPKLGTAPVDGTYGLFIAGQGQELLDFNLKQGDALGFDRSNDGVVQWMYAVAGNSRNRLDITQTYEWRRLPAGAGN